MKIVVTGSRGFIGQHLLEKLKDHNIVEWDLKIGKNIKNFYIDKDTDLVIHLAALIDARESFKKAEAYWRTNAKYSKRVFLEASEIPVIYASSACVKQWHRSVYGLSKKVMEEFALKKHIGLRFETVYGPGASKNSFIYKLEKNQLQYATNHIRDFVHVYDVVSAINLFINSKDKIGRRVFEVGTGKGVSVKDLANEFGFDVPILETGTSEIRKSIAKNGPMLKLGWQPKQNLYTYLKSKKAFRP